MESSEEAERKEGEKKEKEIEDKSEVQRKHLVDKAQRTDLELLLSERKEEDVKEKSRKMNTSPRVKQVLGKSGRWLFLLLILVQSWMCIDAAAGRLEQEGEAEVPKIIIVSDAVRGTKVHLEGKSLQEKQMDKLPRKWKRSKRVDWTEMRKEEKRLKCTLLKDQRGAQRRST